MNASIGGKLLLAILVLLASSATAEASTLLTLLGPRHDPNVRPFFDAGYSLPIHYGHLESGYGMGFGLEIEQTRHASLLFRMEYDALVREGHSLLPYEVYYLRQRSSANSWMVGVRGYATRQGLRPYGELDFGLRLEGKLEGSYDLLALTLDRDSNVDGPVGTGRIGLSAARPGGAGLLLESGFEFVIHNPGDFALVPIRIGIVFP